MKEFVNAAKKRKSVRKYDKNLHLSQPELEKVKQSLDSCQPLVEGIETEYKIVPASQTKCSLNGEYCLLFYSQEKPLFLQNAGYILEQWDLKMADMNIGVCWYGMAHEKSTEDKKYVIMMCFGKCREEDFRTEEQFKRKKVSDIWQYEGDLLQVAQLARLAPSAINSQPWLVKGKEGCLEVFQQKNFLGAISKRVSEWFNKIDMGIFLVFLEMALSEYGFDYQREVEEKNPLAKYRLTKI